MNVAGRRVLVFGMARSGVAAATLALASGARVTCTDRRPDAPVLPGTVPVYGAHRREDFLGAELIVVSPGVPPTQPDLAAAVEAGVPVVGELAFAASFLGTVPIYAVSGTNGKSTTTALLGQILERAGRRTFTGGNLGRPLSEAVGGDWEAAAVEVSSYQMDFPGEFHPHAAVILNLTPDHLERHGTMDTYGARKCRMFTRMLAEDAAILPHDDARLHKLALTLPGTRYYLGSRPGIELYPDRLELHGVGDDGSIPLDGFTLAGEHNRWNLAAAVLCAVAGGVPLARVRVAGLEGLPHRMEVVGERAGVRWINDSKATNLESTMAALRGLSEPLVVLLGGRGKEGATYHRLSPYLRRARAVLCFGEAGPRIHRALHDEGLRPELFGSLEEAVHRAAALARPGDSVLLSPACASFDAFTDFEHRGRQFRSLVDRLPAG